jgi:hypothetical protein
MSSSEPISSYTIGRVVTINPDVENGIWTSSLDGKVGHVVDFDEDKDGQLKVGVKWQTGSLKSHYLDEITVI